jgi:hypothetical protein
MFAPPRVERKPDAAQKKLAPALSQVVRASAIALHKMLLRCAHPYCEAKSKLLGTRSILPH